MLEDNDKSRNISETIIPIDFSPNDGKGPGQTFKFKLVHAALLFFGSIFGFSGWFVLTAKSVFVHVAPISGLAIPQTLPCNIIGDFCCCPSISTRWWG